MNRPRFAAAFVRRATLCTAALSAALLAGADASAQSLDLGPTDFHVTQSIQSGFTPLTGGKSTMVRVKVRALGTIPPGTVYDGVLHMYDNGVEVPGSPFYSDNGPLTPTPIPDLTVIDGTLNFIVLPPQSSNVTFTVHVNPPGPTQVPESSYANNQLTSAPQDFACRENPEIVFVPVNVTVPPQLGPPDFNNVKPGIGDAFYQAIYPAPDANYHRSVAPTKIWTQSVQSSSGGNALNVALAMDMQMMNPVPDFIYGWVKGGLPGYNGVAIGIPGVAAMGNTEPIRMQRTMAHELGHLFGLPHNTSVSAIVGIDVEHQLNLTQGLPVLKPTSQKDIMYAGLLTHEAWVRESNYNFFANHASMQCTGDAQAEDATPPRRLLIGGLQDFDAKRVTVQSSLVVEGGKETPFVPLDRADLILHVFEGETLAAELGITTKSSADCPACGGEADVEHDVEHGDEDAGATADEQGAATPIGGFATLLPAGLDPEKITRVAFVDPQSGGAMASLDRSEHAPAVAFGGVQHVGDGQAVVAWDAADADGDAVTSFLLYSHDGARVTPLATDLDGTRVTIDFDELPEVQLGTSYFEVVVSDGLRTSSTRHVIESGSGAEGGGNRPHVSLYSPDSGKQYARGANVVLHTHAWDIEEGRLDGASVVWTSDVDGTIGDGRLLTVKDLSVGSHLIRATVTDSSGKIAIDSSTIEIIDRPLPGGVCQTDLGFGGPGTAVLSVCGGDLSAGTTADLAVTGAAPTAPLYVAVGFASNPVSALGGTLAVNPVSIVVPAVTDASGGFTLADAVQGGGGPMTLFVQATYVDAGEPQGFGITNAVRVDVQP